MAWLEHHKKSEALASAAHVAKMENDLAAAHSLFLEAGRAEMKALESLNPKEKSRTFSVTAVSTASLFYKGGDLRQAEMVAYSCLAKDSILDFLITHKAPQTSGPSPGKAYTRRLHWRCVPSLPPC